MGVIALFASITLLCGLWRCFHQHTMAEHVLNRHATGHSFFPHQITSAQRRIDSGRPDLSVRVRHYIDQTIHFLRMWIRMKAGTSRQQRGNDEQQRTGPHYWILSQRPGLDVRAVVRNENGVLVTSNPQERLDEIVDAENGHIRWYELSRIPSSTSLQ